MMVRKVVVVPARLRPTRQTSSPAASSKATLRRISLFCISTLRFSTSSIAVLPSNDGGHDVGAGTNGCGASIRENSTVMNCNDSIGIAEHDVHVVLYLDDGLDSHLPRRLNEDTHNRRFVGV